MRKTVFLCVALCLVLLLAGCKPDSDLVPFTSIDPMEGFATIKLTDYQSHLDNASCIIIERMGPGSSSWETVYRIDVDNYIASNITIFPDFVDYFTEPGKQYRYSISISSNSSWSDDNIFITPEKGLGEISFDIGHATYGHGVLTFTEPPAVSLYKLPFPYKPELWFSFSISGTSYSYMVDLYGKETINVWQDIQNRHPGDATYLSKTYTLLKVDFMYTMTIEGVTYYYTCTRQYPSGSPDIPTFTTPASW